MTGSCGVGAKSEVVLPWRVPVWQQGPPHSILIVIKGRGTGLAVMLQHMQVQYGDLGIAMELEWGADGPQPYTI